MRDSDTSDISTKKWDFDGYLISAIVAIQVIMVLKNGAYPKILSQLAVMLSTRKKFWIAYVE